MSACVPLLVHVSLLSRIISFVTYSEIGLELLLNRVQLRLSQVRGPWPLFVLYVFIVPCEREKYMI